MSVEFIGFITNNNSSETIVRTGPVLDRRYIETVAKAHESAGFDRADGGFALRIERCDSAHIHRVRDNQPAECHLISKQPGENARRERRDLRRL